jgi:TrmH family RNA methyltransferase
MAKITSLSNEKVKLVRALARRRVRWHEKCFVLEGTRLLSEAVHSEIDVRYVLYTELAAENPDIAPLLTVLRQRQIPCHPVTDEVMSACTVMVTSQGVLAVVSFPDVPAPPDPTWLLIVDSMRTPGNLGAILRTAAAADVSQVFLSPGTVDFYNPKVVQGGAGAHFRLPVLALSWAEIKDRLAGFEIWLADSQGDHVYTNVNWQGSVALIIGGEAKGASQTALALARGRVTIPMARAVESLNAAVAAGIIMFEIVRQRQSCGRIEE